MNKFHTNFKSTPIFVITTFNCNLKCKFCLFRFNEIPDCDINMQAEKLNRMLQLCKDNGRKIKVKITGGEPLIKNIEPLLDTVDNYEVDFIGIGTNATIQLPKYFNDVKSKTNIYLSLHTINELHGKGKLQVADFHRLVDNPNIKYRISCNLIKGQIDNTKSLTEYLNDVPKEVDFICFRELNSISVDKNSIYPKYVYEYIDYRKENLILIKDILKNIDNKWEHLYTDNLGFVQNIYYRYNNKIILFRTMNEELLIDYADENPNIIDEIVIHPDGLITGCWDRDRKFIEGGTNDALQTVPSKT